MSKGLSVLFLLMANISAFASDYHWCDSQWRDANYPQDVYYVGYASYVKQINESQNDAISKAKEEALHQLSQQIIVNVSSASTSNITAVTSNQGYDEQEMFEHISSITSQAKITNIKTECFYDNKTLTAHAMAFVVKEELINTYHKELDILISRIDNHFAISNSLIEKNEKTIAQNECDSALMYIPKLEDCIKMLAVIDPNFSHGEYLTKLSDYKINAQSLKSQLQQSIKVILKIEGTMATNYQNLLSGELLGGLTENDCSVCENEQEADYIITLLPSLRLSSSDGDIQYVFADINVDLYNTYKNKTTYTNSYSAKGAGVSTDKANRKAISKTANLISNDLITKIK